MGFFALNSISKKFLLPTLVLTIALMGGLGVIMAMNSNASVGAMMLSKGNAVADFMSKISVNAYANFDYLTLENLAKQISRDPEVAYAVFYDAGRKPLTVETTKKDDASLLIFTRTIMDDTGNVFGHLKIAYTRKMLFSNLQKSMMIIAASVVVALVLLVSGMTVLSRRIIMKPIMHMKKAAEEIAAGDLTSVIETKGHDEMALLGNAINTMAGNLKDTLGKIRSVTESLSNVTTRIASSSENVLAVADVQKTAIERSAATMGEMLDSTAAVASGAESLSLSAVDTSSAISQMKQAIERVSESSNVFEASTNEAASSIEEMFANIKEISQALESLSSSSEGIASSVSEVNTTVKEIEEHATRSVGLSEQVVVDASDKGEAAAHAATEGMEDIRRSVGVLSEVINVLGKRSVDIGTILSVIEEVTERTTLLSLNAAILAAQAGEHGKSFSVVADEIKSLAERTAHSTREISQLINSVQTETRSSVKMAGEGLLAVEKGLTLVGEVHEALKGITQSSLASTEMSKAIQRSTSEESQAIRQINDAVVEMTKQVEKISNALQEQNRGGKFVIEQTETMKEMSHHVKTALGEQRDGSRQIASAVEDVAHQAESIAQATGMQKQKSSEMVQSMNEIRHTTGNLMHSSKEMNAAIEALKGDAGNLLAALQKFRV